MVEYKKQHYVPQFYLKRFSDDGTGLCRYLLASKASERRSIDKIATLFWFYGEGQVAPIFERAMSTLEEQHSKIFEEILEKQRLMLKEIVPPHTPQITSEDERYWHNYFNLLRFVILTATRTKQAKKESEALANTIWKTLLARSEKAKESGISPEAIEQLTLTRDKAAVESMGLAINPGPLFLLDLDMKLLVNKTGVPFFTSDSPAVFVFHRFPMQKEPNAEDWELLSKKLPSLGALSAWKIILDWQAPGLMIFLPLSEEITLWLFDPRVYKPIDDTEDCVFLSNKSDVNELNKLQALNADEFLIFSNPNCSDEYISSLHNELEGRRAQRTAEMKKFGYSKIFYESQFSFLSVNEEAYKEKAAEFASGLPIVVRNRALVVEALLASGAIPTKIDKVRRNFLESLANRIMSEMAIQGFTGVESVDDETWDDAFMGKIHPLLEKAIAEYNLVADDLFYMGVWFGRQSVL